LDARVHITELSGHTLGQLVAVHPAYDPAFDGIAPALLRGRSDARTDWAIDRLKKAAGASARLGLRATVSFAGSLAFPYP
jgi:hypothetical protein